MSVSALARLEASQTALIDALDTHEIAPLEAALGAMRSALEEVRAVGVWRHVPDVPAHAKRIKQLAEAAQVRVNILTDLNLHQRDTMALLRGEAPVASYGRRARRA